VRGTVASEPLARLDYVSVTEADTLDPLEKLNDRPVLIALAVHLGKTRLIDNIVLNRKKNGGSADNS
jgi:pantoate--beta-alanine ligase